MNNKIKSFRLDKSVFTTVPVRIISVIFPFGLAFALYFLRDSLKYIGRHLWRCMLYDTTGFYCPGCGNTRSVLRLLEGNILGSLRYNIFPILVILFFLLGYAEYLTFSFGHHIKLFPRKFSFWLVFTIFLGFYYVVRNFIPFLVP